MYVSDELCRKYGLSIVETERSQKAMGISKSRINHYVRNDEKMQLVKKDIDNAIQKANSYRHFKEHLYEKNYDIKDNGKYLTLTTPYFKRNVRIERFFGDDYSRGNITLKGERENWYRLLKKETNAGNKTIIQAKIDLLTEKINNLHSKIRIGERCVYRIQILQTECLEIKKRTKELNMKDFKIKSKGLIR